MTETITKTGAEQVLWYKRHIKANYVIEREEEVENIATGELLPLNPDTIYVLDKHEKHRLKSFTGLRPMCVFSPSLTGNETHDEDEAYSPSTE